MRVFNANAKLKKDILKAQIKKHPKWEKRKNIINILKIIQYGIYILATAIAFIDQSNYTGISTNAKEKIIMNLLVYNGLACILIWLPIYIYMNIFSNECTDDYMSNNNEKLTIDDEIFTYTFSFRNGAINNVMHEIKFKDINKIVVNDYHKRVDIYCKATIQNYNTTSEPVYNFYNERLYFYFDNMDEFIREIAEKSGLEIEIRNYAEGNAMDCMINEGVYKRS